MFGEVGGEFANDVEDGRYDGVVEQRANEAGWWCVDRMGFVVELMAQGSFKLIGDGRKPWIEIHILAKSLADLERPQTLLGRQLSGGSQTVVAAKRSNPGLVLVAQAEPFKGPGQLCGRAVVRLTTDAKPPPHLNGCPQAKE